MFKKVYEPNESKSVQDELNTVPQAQRKHYHYSFSIILETIIGLLVLASLIAALLLP